MPYWGISTFYKASTTIDPHNIDKASALVTTGIYRFSRNPMYLGLFCMLFAVGFYFGNILTLFVVPLFVLYMNHFQIIPEEEILLKKFEDRYREYRSKVRRWV